MLEIVMDNHQCACQSHVLDDILEQQRCGRCKSRWTHASVSKA
jgi:hypothetical protein